MGPFVFVFRLKSVSRVADFKPDFWDSRLLQTQLLNKEIRKCPIPGEN